MQRGKHGLYRDERTGRGLISRSEAAMAFMSQFDNALPIWGIQKEKELEEWLSYMAETHRP